MRWSRNSRSMDRPAPVGQRGMAVAMIMVVLGALMLIGAVGAGLLSANLRTAGAQRIAARALYCAEAGLAAGRTFFLANAGMVNAILQCNAGQAACPTGYPVRGSAASDGSASFEVTISDNYDELPPQQGNPLQDADLIVILTSRCTDAALPPRVISQHVSFDTSQISDYRAQSGFGRANAGNQN